MHTLYKNRPKPPKGDRLWRNPTDRTLKITIFVGTKKTLQVVEPGATLALPKAWPDKTVRNVCRHLVPADEAPPAPPAPPVTVAPKPEEAAPDSTPDIESTPLPDEAAEALGDPGKVQSADDRKDGKEATHTSGDALEQFAQTLIKKGKPWLVKQCKSEGLSYIGSKAKLARALALKSVEDGG